MSDDYNPITPQPDDVPHGTEPSGTSNPYTAGGQPTPTYHAPQTNYGYPYSGVQNSGYTPNGAPMYTAPQGGTVPPAPKKPKKKTGLIVFLSILGACFVLSLVVLLVSFFTDGSTHKKHDTPPDFAIGTAPQTPLEDGEGNLTAKGVYEKVKDSSVGILVYKNSSFSNAALAGQGSGVIVGEDDAHTSTYIVTCAHVISGGETVKVQLHDETQYDATIVGYDSRTDIGVLRVRTTGLTACELGDSDKLSVGEPVYAIGNPGGVSFAGSFTNGMVSAIARPVNSEIGYEMRCIQHTAAINPGNSGGALVNAAGQLVGINSSKIAGEGFEGMGFSVPSITVKEVFEEIVRNGYVTNRPKLGVQYFPASSNQLYSMIVGANHLPAGSIVIQAVTPDSDLANHDIQKGDMITEVNGKPLDTVEVLPDLIEESKVGDELVLTVCRVDVKNNYAVSQTKVKVKLVEDRGTAPATDPTANKQEHNFYNPFDNFPFGR